MGEGQQNLRRALEDEGLSPEEVGAYLREKDRDPLERARRAGVPQLYLGRYFGDLKEDERRDAIAAARRWAEAFEPRRRAWKPEVPRGIYLWASGDGSPDTGFGTGKTAIAAAAAQHLLGQGCSVRWVKVARQMTNLNLPFAHPMYAKAAARLGEPREGEVIVLDDIDKLPPTERNIQPLFALLSDCAEEEIPLLITANRNPDDLAEDWGRRFGDASASRIIGHCLDVEVPGRDRRLDR